jgi:ribonuclease HI
MTYVFPESLFSLRDYLKSLGCDVSAFKTARQAAFMAQQLLGSRVKFPPAGSDMSSTLWLIQQHVPGRKPTAVQRPKVTPVAPAPDLFGDCKATGKIDKKAKPQKLQPEYLRAFHPDVIKSGYHVFADGAAVPNPGAGGWGIATFRDGHEIYSESGSDQDTTNNAMELTSLLRAIRWAMQYPTVVITIWSDSQYAVHGANVWRHKWKTNGWQRGGEKAEMHNRVLLNADLWREIDAELCDPRAANVKVYWVKGHAGILGNERADELAEIGRQSIERQPDEWIDDDLDSQYRAIMAE